MSGLGVGSIVARFIGAFLLIAASYNPEGRSYYHWVIQELPDFNAVKAFFGVLLTIGWTVLLRKATRSLGVVGLMLGIALFGTMIWMALDYGIIAKDSPRVITYVSMAAHAGLLTAGMVWSQVRRGFTDPGEVGDAHAD